MKEGADPTPRRLAAFAEQGKDQEELIGKMLSSNDLLVQMAVGDGAKAGNYGAAMLIYRKIWQASDKVAKGSSWRLALAISLEHATPLKQRNAVAKADAPEFLDPVKCYLHFEKSLGFRYGLSLYTQKGVIEKSKARTLAAVGEDIGERKKRSVLLEGRRCQRDYNQRPSPWFPPRVGLPGGEVLEG
ncbi:MAG: hypothetical protein OSA93_07680 [Akkermansiaceae bacterium]|nr:hypothetical protein [Akkermansiaceae bacterium]